MKHRTKIDRCIYTLVGVCMCVFLLPSTHVYAQAQGMGGDTRIDTDPLYPIAGEPFTARLADYSGTLGAGDLLWYVDGVLQKASKNQQSITLAAPPVGKPLLIRAERSTSYGHKGVSLVVVPNEVDIIVESNTTAPYFYAGRRVPGNGTKARIVAIPHIYTAKGVLLSPSDLSYSWNVDNENKEGGNGGALETNVSGFGNSLVRLSIDSRDHLTKYETSFFIETAEPSFSFYTYSPLTGLSQNAVQDSYLPAKNEVTVRAQPYGMSSDIYKNAQYNWSINGETVQNANRDPQMITLRKSGSGGTSDIGFSLRNLTALSQYAQGLFKVDFK